MDKDSPIHRLNALTKLSIALVLNVLALIIQGIYASLGLLAITIFLLLIAKIKLSMIRKLAIGFSFIILNFFFFWGLFSRIPGSIVFFRLPWGTYFTDRTLEWIIYLYVRFQVMFLATILFLSTTNDVEFSAALKWLHFPHWFSFMMGLALRSVSIAYDDIFTLMEAMRSKGLDFQKGSIPERIRKYLYLGAPLLILLFRKVEEFSHAAEARAFSISGKGTSTYRRLQWKRLDCVVMAIFVCALAAGLFARYYLGYFTF